MGRAKFRGRERGFCGRSCAAVANQTLNGRDNYVVRGLAACIRRHGRIYCEICQVETLAVLEVHHQDGNRKNNVDENLKTLCANCHAAIHRTGSARRARLVKLADVLAKIKEEAVPLLRGKGRKVVSENISEFHKGETYAKTARKFGKAKADKQAVAVALDTARRGK